MSVYYTLVKAKLYTMVEMAKANDLNTYKYLTYLLSQQPNDKMSDEQLEQLAPWSSLRKLTVKTKIEEKACIYHLGASVIYE